MVASESLDAYIQNVVRVGDEGSRLLNRLLAPTLQNSPYVAVLEDDMNGLAVIRLPKGHYAVVHSCSGNPNETDPASHAASLVDRLVEQARFINATPLAFANVIDSATGDLHLLETIAAALAEKADEHHLPIMNGENAILGDRIQCQANVSGTMISMLPMIGVPQPTKMTRGGTTYAAFDPAMKPVYMNSDGVGTKTEFYERARLYKPALLDSLAMKLDDAVKRGARAEVVSDVVEINQPFQSSSQLMEYASKLGKLLQLSYALQFEHVFNRLGSYKYGAFACNISGSAVSVIDEHRLRNPLKPQSGDYLIAIRGKPSPRSNGITAKRRAMIEHYGKAWHKQEAANYLLDYLTTPSTVFYGLFYTLIDRHLVTSVYHLSGGAYDGKLARPLAKHGLYVHLENLFPLTPAELFFVNGNNSLDEITAAYAKWPMHAEGFVTTHDPEKVINYIERNGLQARHVGRLEKRADGKTGVELLAFDKVAVHFSGKD